jgi:mono/diheme cytochrome c family protein
MPTCPRNLRWLLFSFVCMHGATSRADDSDRARDAFFEEKVRPVFVEHCSKCHGAEKQKGSLRLDSREAIIAGGDRGPALSPGEPEKSLLIRAVRQSDPDLRMPPKGKLSKTQVECLANWIRMGAPWPKSNNASATAARREFQITEKDRAYWAFQPVRRPPLPTVRDTRWPANPVDYFILQRLDAAKLAPNPSASKRELIRRAYFDLIGLPPTPEEVATFVADQLPSAWERLIDRLLANPHYGERWGRHWLDVVRFAQSNGYERDDEKPLAWRYRDYVIDAFNADKPYDRFIREQLAGDELPGANDESRIATGFYRLGVWDDEPDDSRQAVYDELDEIIATTGQAFLGLTINCARCHNHMFDPISQRDYYSLLSFIQNIRAYEAPKFAVDSADFTLLGAVVKAAGQKNPPPAGWALAVREKGAKPPETHVLIRGNSGTPGDAVQPAFLAVIDPTPPKLPSVKADSPTCGRRPVLAEWIANSKNPLTARVLVNRLWQHHFGRGIVPTPNDFGKAGSPPSHPELLDWLTAEFEASGWSIKHMQRLIMLSSAYQMSARANRSEALAADEANQLFWRQSMQRLEAETIRDSVLAVSGTLNLRMGGRGFFPALSREVISGQSKPGFGWEIQRGSELERRSVYIFIKRNLLVPFLECFDYTNTAQPLGARPVTTVAPQALMLLNSDFMQDQAACLAERVEQEAGADRGAQIARAYERTLARPPSAQEARIAFDYLANQEKKIQQLGLPLTVSSKAPASISADYLRKMSPDDFIGCSMLGWSRHKGRWGNGYEGIDSAEPATGPFALYDGISVGDAAFETQIFLHSTAQLGGILWRANSTNGVLRGYDATFDPRAGLAYLRRHDEHGASILAQADCKVSTGTWYKVRVEVTGAKFRVWVGESAGTGTAPPLLEATDPRPIVESGRFGVRVWGAPVSTQSWAIQAHGHRLEIPGEKRFSADEARKQALRVFCLVMLNLNEFVFID